MADEALSQIPAFISIFGLAWFYFWPAIPAGLALGLPPALVVTATTLSYASGVALVTLAGGPVRSWALRRLGRRAEETDSRMQRIWRRFGAVGLGLAAPVTLGAQIGAAVGITLNAPPRRLLLWMALGGLAWSVLLTALVMLGVLGAQTLTGG